MMISEVVNIPLGALKMILLKALSWYFVHEHMTKQTGISNVYLYQVMETAYFMQ